MGSKSSSSSFYLLVHLNTCSWTAHTLTVASWVPQETDWNGGSCRECSLRKYLWEGKETWLGSGRNSAVVQTQTTASDNRTGSPEAKMSQQWSCTGLKYSIWAFLPSAHSVFRCRSPLKGAALDKMLSTVYQAINGLRAEGSLYMELPTTGTARASLRR